MKYKKHLATGALAISLLVSGSSVFAASPQDLGIKNVHSSAYLKQNKNNKDFRTRKMGRSNVVGTIETITSTGFNVGVKNMKIKVVASVDVQTNASTAYYKNGLSASFADLAVGQKVIVFGTLDKTTNILTAKIVKIVKLKQ